MYGNIVNHDLHWIAGDSVNSEITFKIDGIAQDLTGYKVLMTVRKVEGETGLDTVSHVKTFSSDTNDFLIETPTNGKIKFNIGSVGTKTLNPKNDLKSQFVYSVEINKDQTAPAVAITRTILRGKLYVHSEISR